ncbi:zinc ribbon domain-containing protein [Thermoproteota archaeon]
MFFLNKKSKTRFYQYRVATASILIILSILAACSQNANAYENGVYWLCKDVDESDYPYKPIDPTTIFYDTDEEVCFLFSVDYVTTSHSIIIKWYDDEDKLFDTINEQIPHPNSGGYTYWTSYSYFNCLPIKGEDAADLPGQWKVELYLDGNKEVTEFFEIKSTTTTTTTTPTTTSNTTHSPTPTPIMPEQEMTITTTPTTTTHQEEEKQVEQSSFLSNPMYIMLIVLSVIVIIILIVISKRKKPMTSQTQQIPNRYCINCGAPAKSGEIFCGSCGKRVE